jgi:hypothetical protein
MQTTERDAGEFEIALLRRGVDRRSAGSARCRGCQRTPLVGERVYVDRRGWVYCELCRGLEDEAMLESRTVRGPEFGHTMRLKKAQADPVTRAA